MTTPRPDDVDAELERIARERKAREIKGNGHAPVTPCNIEHTLAVFEKWLVLPDKTPVLALLGAVAANYLPGDCLLYTSDAADE